MTLLSTVTEKTGYIMSPEIGGAMRSASIPDVYDMCIQVHVAKKEETESQKMLTELYLYYRDNPMAMSGEYCRSDQRGRTAGTGGLRLYFGNVGSVFHR
jgi:hypothetical protein